MTFELRQTIELKILNQLRHLKSKMVFQLSFLIILKFLPKIKKVEDSDFVQFEPN